LHLPTSVGGNAWSLAQGERELGLESRVLCASGNWLKYPCDISLHLEQVDNPFVKLARLTAAFLKVRNSYDIYHFNYGSSLIHTAGVGLHHLELPFYPKNKKLFVTYNGCDARQKYPTTKRRTISACHDPDCYEGMCNSGRRDRCKRKSIRKMAAYVKHMWAVNPDLLYFLPPEKSSFLPYAVAVDTTGVVPPDFSKRKLTIVHSPTNRACKGSSYILDALQHIRKSHRNYFEVKLVENVPHEHALHMYRQADLVIDQLLVGWYGGFAVEAMSMGKPVICRIESEDLRFVPKQMADDVLRAFIQGEPPTITDVILRCLEDRRFLREKAEAGTEYARTWHDPRYVARITKEKYEH
jgi:hypothetical protein